MEAADTRQISETNRNNTAYHQAEADFIKGLSVRNIDKRFGTVQAVKNVSLDVYAGEFFGR